MTTLCSTMQHDTKTLTHCNRARNVYLSTIFIYLGV